MELTLPGEKENKKIGLIVTIAIHLLLLIIFFFAVVWREQFPPIGKVGIPGVMVDFGTSDNGKGNTRSEAEQVSDEPKEAQAPEQVEQTETQPVDAPADPAEQTLAHTPLDNPHKVSTKADNTSKSDPKPVQQPSKPVEKPKIDPKFQMPTGGDGDSQKADDQGSKNGTQSDNKKGTVPGEGGTNGLDQFGWGWHTPPKEHYEADRGYIVFKFEVDEAGYFKWVELDDFTVKPTTANHYLKQLRDHARLQKTGETVQYRGSFTMKIGVK